VPAKDGQMMEWNFEFNSNRESHTEDRKLLDHRPITKGKPKLSKPDHPLLAYDMVI
jgi:hypothetical protein